MSLTCESPAFINIFTSICISQSQQNHTQTRCHGPTAMRRASLDGLRAEIKRIENTDRRIDEERSP